MKFEQGNPSDALEFIGSKWKEFDPTRPMQYFYLDERIQLQYVNEIALGRVARIFCNNFDIDFMLRIVWTRFIHN